jgi:hypothetical protein
VRGNAGAARQVELVALWFGTAGKTGKPKGLTWVRCEVLGEPTFGNGWAVLPVLVTFEPTADGPLADVPQAWEPRAVVAVFNYARRRWTTGGRAVFNLTPAQVATRLANGAL